MNRSEQLLRTLIREAIDQELNEFQVGNFKLPNIKVPNLSGKNSKETPEQSSAKKYLDAHFSGSSPLNYNDAQIKNLISKLSPEDQKVYNNKLTQKNQTTQNHSGSDTTAQNKQFASNRNEYNKERFDARSDGWYGESKRR